ncbi:hypothetical protein VNO78_19860 [Psophocarpus tetragonolobus]|uniref:Uncharacterized protein n=1 Tax=Psophocarpus tetragonolobus TaxID=3891 RepID=A0AAN9S8C7_PSOTE
MSRKRDIEFEEGNGSGKYRGRGVEVLLVAFVSLVVWIGGGVRIEETIKKDHGVGVDIINNREKGHNEGLQRECVAKGCKGNGVPGSMLRVDIDKEDGGGGKRE